MRTPSKVKFTAHLDRPVTTLQAATMAKKIHQYTLDNDLGHGDPYFDVLVENTENGERASVLINPGLAEDGIIDKLRKAQGMVGA